MLELSGLSPIDLDMLEEQMSSVFPPPNAAAQPLSQGGSVSASPAIPSMINQSQAA
jgi:hypothetical protein